MSKEHDILKSLLLKEELQLLDRIKQKVLSQEQFTKEVSKVLGGAIKRAQKEGKGFEQALFEPIQKGVTRAFSENKQSIIDSLLPIMGQLIRKTVANSIKQFVADINRTLELGFSTKALKWRWQAFKTGKSFAEIVFQKTIRYKVDEIFLINQENGLLIEHVGTDDMLKDNNAISAMLSVIQEFIGDSLQSPDDRLQSAEMGDNVLVFSHGPKAFLVFVLKGSPTERFKVKAQKLIENVHAEFSEALSTEQEYRTNSNLRHYLRSHLITKNINDFQQKINWIPWIVGVLTIVIGLVYWSYQKSREYKNLVDTTNTIDGLFVQSIMKKDGKFNISGLLDPLADTSELQLEDVVLNTKPFISLDVEMIKKRAELVTADFDGVTIKIDNQILTVEGLISPENQTKLIQKLSTIAGVKKVNNLLTIDYPTSIAIFTESFFSSSDGIEFTISKNKVSLSGVLSYKKHQNYIQETKSEFPEIQVVSTKLNISDSSQVLINKINTAVINVPLLKAKDSEQIRFMAEITYSIKQLLQRGDVFSIAIMGQSDCYGTLSNEFSSNRAETIMKALLQSSINPVVMTTKIQGCDRFNRPYNDGQKNVSFLIEPTHGDEL